MDLILEKRENSLRTGRMRQVDRTATFANVVAAIRLESRGNIVAATRFQFYVTN